MGWTGLQGLLLRASRTPSEGEPSAPPGDLVKATQTPHGAHTRIPSILFTFVSWLDFEKYLYAYQVTGVILVLYK